MVYEYIYIYVAVCACVWRPEIVLCHLLLLSASIFYIIYLLRVCAYHSVHMEIRTQLTVASSLQHVDSKDQSQVIRFGSRHLYLLSHLPSPPT